MLLIMFLIHVYFNQSQEVILFYTFSPVISFDLHVSLYDCWTIRFCVDENCQLLLSITEGSAKYFSCNYWPVIF